MSLKQQLLQKCASSGCYKQQNTLQKPSPGEYIGLGKINMFNPWFTCGLQVVPLRDHLEQHTIAKLLF